MTKRPRKTTTNSSTWPRPEPKEEENFNGSYFKLESIGMTVPGDERMLVPNAAVKFQPQWTLIPRPYKDFATLPHNLCSYLWSSSLGEQELS